ncbi:replication-associated recombination protein A [Candidatus Pacearchaeota archaeon]|nr:replication-associated recombination protein A [Candidatus Pacearchaeota archaeon]
MNKPLAYRMRPETLEEFVGQEHLVGENKPLRLSLEKGELASSIILWGPPGCGKTTIARLISKITDSEFIELSAVKAGKADIEKAIQRAKLFHKKTILFLDEIHRFNKAQQDYLLPSVENGTLTLIGATTENPSFEIISALLSRSRVFTLTSLTENHLTQILNQTIKKEFQNKIIISEENKNLISQIANGDARSALNILEIAISLSKDSEITKEIISNSAQKFIRYDKNGEEHHNIISALHKSMRDSDPQGAVYWTMRMVEGGEDPKYIIRRMIRFASEDIGNADPQALQIAVSAKQAIEFIGYPECNTALVQTATYLATAPKSNAVYKAVLKSQADIKKTGNLSVPMHLRNTPTSLMKNLGYGKGYQYAHDFENAKVEQEHLPEELKHTKYYEPTERGFEKTIKERMKKDNTQE